MQELEPSTSKRVERKQCLESEQRPKPGLAKISVVTKTESKYKAGQLKSKELIESTRHQIAVMAREVQPSVDKSLFRDPEVCESQVTLPFAYYSKFESNIR